MKWGLMFLAMLASTPAGAQTTPTFVQLFGPVQYPGGALVQHVGPNFIFPGAALTASTKTFNFQASFPTVGWAVWKHIWIPNGASVRLVSMDDGPANIVELVAPIQANATNPINTAVDITTVFNTLVANKQYKHIGFQIKDNFNDWYLFESRLEILFNR